MTAYKKIQTKKYKNNTRHNNKSRRVNRKKTSNHFRHVGAKKSSLKRLTRTLKRTQYKEVSPSIFL